jgi:hypothetical protein
MPSGSTTAPSGETSISPACSSNRSEKSHTNGVLDLIDSAEALRRSEGTRARHSSSRGSSRGDWGIQQQAWRWATANRTPGGDLSPGKAIAHQFGRSERWGRLVKQAGLAGGLDREAATQV